MHRAALVLLLNGLTSLSPRTQADWFVRSPRGGHYDLGAREAGDVRLAAATESNVVTISAAIY
jgi:hypothetical protein